MTAAVFAKDRHRPEGEWVQTTTVEKVAGVAHRLPNAAAFAEAAKSAERKGRRYGVSLRFEPNNPVDANAIAVIGWAVTKGWLTREWRQEWHIGYLAAETAAELHRDLIAKGHPIAAELYSIFQSGGFLDFNIIVLAPPGFSQSSRARSGTPQPSSVGDVRAQVATLLDAGKTDAAISLLLDACDREEEVSKAKDWNVAPWCYEDLVKLFGPVRMGREGLSLCVVAMPAVCDVTGQGSSGRVAKYRQKTLLEHWGASERGSIKPLCSVSAADFQSLKDPNLCPAVETICSPANLYYSQHFQSRASWDAPYRIDRSSLEFKVIAAIVRIDTDIEWFRSHHRFSKHLIQR